MSILKDILGVRYISQKIGAELESICLKSGDVKRLALELTTSYIGVCLIGPADINAMEFKGIITEPLKIFGMKVISNKRG